MASMCNWFRQSAYALFRATRLSWWIVGRCRLLPGCEGLRVNTNGSPGTPVVDLQSTAVTWNSGLNSERR
jgi:hypothetical protein